jgi:hypothetical protein
MKIQNYSIIVISIIYGFIVKFGYIGFGIDYFYAYHKSNVIGSSIFNSVGWYLTTLNLFNTQLGIFLVPFLISLSTGYLLKYFFTIQNLNSRFFFIIILIFSLFSWPLVISSNNAMRQGLMMSFIFFSIVLIADKKFYFGIFFILIATFTHRSGIAFLFVTSSIYFYKTLFEKFFINRGSNYLIFGFLIFTISLIINLLDQTYYGRYGSNTAIGIDFTYLNILINLLFIIYFTIYHKLLKNYLLLFLYFFSFSALAIFCAGLNWEYERYNMIMIAAYIYAFAICFEINSKYIYLLTSLFILFILTILTGMYDFGVGVYSWTEINK